MAKESKVVSKNASKKASTNKVAAKKAPKGNKNMPSKYTAQPKDFGIGRDTPYKRDISRFMRWPLFVTAQRKKRVLERRMKVPPTLNQFRQTLDRSTRTNLLKLLQKYKPETAKDRKARINEAAKAKAADKKKAVATKAPLALTTGLQEVTRAIEKGSARLVVIASNVDPIELVVWMPTLCRAQKVPYCIVKDKARLGELVGQSVCACVAIKNVHAEDEAELASLTKSIKARFSARANVLQKKWGGLQMSLRSAAKLRKHGRVVTSHAAKSTADADDE